MGETLVTELFGDTALRRQTRMRSEEEFQARRTAAALAVAGALALLCGAAAAEIVARRHGMRVVPSGVVDGLYRAVRERTWTDPEVRAAGWGILAAGLALLAHAVTPERVPMEAMRGADPGVSAGLSRFALARSLENAVLAVPGVKAAEARIGRRITVTVRTGLRNPGNLADVARRALIARLTEIDPLHRREAVVTVLWRR